MDAWWMEQVQQPPAGKANIQTWPKLAWSPSCPLPWLAVGVAVCSCMHVHMSLSVWVSTLSAAGLDSCKSGHRAGRQHLQVIQYYSRMDSVIRGWKKRTEYDSEADGDDGDDGDDGGDRLCSITGRLMNYPSTEPLCVNAALNYLVVFWESTKHPAHIQGNVLIWGVEKKQDKHRDKLSQKNLGLSLPLPLMLVWSHLIDIFLTDCGPGLCSKVAAF